MKNILIAVVLVVSLVSTASSAVDGVYVTRPHTEDEVDNLLNEFVRRVIISSVLEETGFLVERIVKGQNIPIYPQFASLSVQQIALQVFKHEELMVTCRDAFDDSLDLLKEERASGHSQDQIKNNVRNNTKELLKPVYKHRLYQKIVEEVIKHSLKEQQKIIILNTTQRQIQMMAVQQQLNQIKQAALQAYLSGITSQAE